MKRPPIDFRKERNFGEVFSGTFVFLSQNFRDLFKALLLYAGPFILGAGIVSGLMQTYLAGMQSDLMNYNVYDPGYDPFGFMTDFAVYYALILFFYVLGYTILIGVTYSYINLYVEKGKGNFTIDEVRKNAFGSFFKILGTNIVVGLLIAVGTLLCCIPGIYVGTSLSIILIIVIHERTGFGDAFQRSFRLTHFQWWWTLLLVFVINGVIGAVSYMFSLPQGIISAFHMFNSMGTEPSEALEVVSLILTMITTILNTLLYVVPLTAYALHYFSLVEKKESPSLLKRVEEIGLDE